MLENKPISHDGTLKDEKPVATDTLSMVEVAPRKARTLWHTFDASKEFTRPWWKASSDEPGTCHWLSFRLDGIEVARCKFNLIEKPHPTPQLGNMPEGQLDILAFEVAASTRRRGIGRKALELIRRRYPMPRLTALNDDAESRKFWDGVGWIRQEPNEVFMRSDRVTYSER